jgi:hypothetical protein
MEILLALAATATVPVLGHLAITRWRQLVLGVMVLVVFEGALRKWLFPGAQAYIYFLKDILLMAAIGGFAISRVPPSAHRPLLNGLTLVLALTGFYCFIHIAHPNIPTILIGLLGFKNYLLYAALAYMVPYCFNSITDLERKLTLYMVLMIPVCLLGLVQFALPPEHWLNVYVQHDNTEMHISTFGSNTEEVRVRASGTFSYIGGYSTFVTVMYLLAFAISVGARSGSTTSRVAFVLLAVSVMATFTTGSRSVFVVGLVATIPILLMLVSVGALSVLIAMRLAVGASIIGLVAYFVALDAIDAFTVRATTSDSNIDRIFSPITEVLGAASQAPIFGLGIGTTHASTGTIMGLASYYDAWWLQGLIAEAEPARIVLELGLPGFALVLAARLIVFVMALRVALMLRTRLLKTLAVTISVYLGLQIVGSIVNNPTGGLYYWFAIGLLFASYRLEQSPQTQSTPWQATPPSINPRIRYR